MVYTVVIAINVPGLGAKTVTQTGVTAANIDAAIAQAIQTITIEATSVVKTG